MKKIIYIILIITFILVDLWISFLTFIDYLAEYKTIKISNQETYIVQEIKEHFKINYDIEKVTFYSGIPDGYYLDIYNKDNQIEGVFEDNHEESEIYDYFKDVKADIPKHLKYLITAIFIEIIILIIVHRKTNNRNR